MKNVKKVLYLMIVIFVFMISFFFIPEEFNRPFFPVLGILALAFLGLGITLIVLGRKLEGNLRVFVLLTGICSVAPLIFSVLHNVFYGIAITFTNLAFIFEPLHAGAFLISLIIAPAGFITGVIGIFVCLRNGQYPKNF